MVNYSKVATVKEKLPTTESANTAFIQRINQRDQLEILGKDMDERG